MRVVYDGAHGRTREERERTWQSVQEKHENRRPKQDSKKQRGSNQNNKRKPNGG